MEPLTVSISLTPSMREFVDQQVSSGEFPSAQELVAHLLDRAARHRRVADRIDALIQEGDESGESFELTPKVFEDLKRGIVERHAQRQGLKA